MKQYLTAVVAVMAASTLWSASAISELQHRLHKVVCMSAAELHAAVPTEIPKRRWMLGKDGIQGMVEWWEDPVTGSWSFIQVMSWKEVCVIQGGYGRGIEINPLTEGRPL